jgi:hypothetical protein
MKSKTQKYFLRIIFSLICFIVIFKTSFINSSKLHLKSNDDNKCLNFNFNKTNFTIDSLIGVWYPVRKSDDLPIIDDCDRITIRNYTNITVEIESFEKYNRFRDTPREIKRLEFFPTKNLNSFKFNLMEIENIFTVVDTDFQNWALIFICSERDKIRKYNAILLSRDYQMDDRKQKDIKKYSEDVLGVELDEELDQGPLKCRSSMS